MKILIPNLTTRSLASNLFEEMDRFFDDWNHHTQIGQIYDEQSFEPASEITETDEHYLICIDLPGLKKENIKIELTDNILTVSGERKRESSDKNKIVQRLEKSYGFFKRSFNCPTSAETNKIEARYEDGVLELYLPKTQSAKPRSIEIQSGKSSLFEKLLGSSKKTNQELKDSNSTMI